MITIGTTTLTAHIHPEWPCEDCQLSATNQIQLDDGYLPLPARDADASEPSRSIPIAMDSKERKENREKNRKREMAALRESLLNGISAPASIPERHYEDRAAIRRKLHPPPPPEADHEKGNTRPPTPTSYTPPPAPAEPTKLGMALLANQGWTPGAGLGRNGSGRSEPVQVQVRTENRGLGAEGSKAVMDVGEGDWRKRGKHRLWEAEAARGG